MPKTNQIARKAYRTSLDRKIEDLKPGSTCSAPTKNNKKSWPWQKTKGQHKGKKTVLHFDIARYK